MRKKWVTRLSAEEAAAAAKTTRHVRCFVRGGKVTLRYLHQVTHAPQDTISQAQDTTCCRVLLTA